MLLDNERLGILENQFEEKPEGITIDYFIRLMEKAIQFPEEEMVDLYDGLIKLFNDIDINADTKMQWSEFTQFIIDTVLSKSSNPFQSIFFTFLFF